MRTAGGLAQALDGGQCAWVAAACRCSQRALEILHLALYSRLLLRRHLRADAL